MSAAGRHKLTRVARHAIDTVCKELLTEIEIFVKTAKAFADSDERAQDIEEAFDVVRNRIFDIGGEEKRRFERFLRCWECKEVVKDVEWIEYPHWVLEPSKQGRKGS